MTTPTNPAANEYDPFASADNPVLPSFELYGLVEINAWACALVKGQGKVPYDPTMHKDLKRFTAIDVFIQPIPEITITNTKALERHWLAESKEWASITLSSIRDAGIENVREVNGKYARIASVPNGKTYEKTRTDGSKETKQGTTFKFLAFYDNEDACRAAYLANGGTPAQGATTVTPAPLVEDPEKATQYAFLRVIVPNAARGKASVADAQAAVTVALAQYPTVAKFFTAQSPETVEIINQTLTAA